MEDFEIIYHDRGEPRPEEPPDRTVVVGLAWGPYTRRNRWEAGQPTDNPRRWDGAEAGYDQWPDVFESVCWGGFPWYEIRRRPRAEGDPVW